MGLALVAAISCQHAAVAAAQPPAQAASAPAAPRGPAPSPAPLHTPYWLERTSFFDRFAAPADVVMAGDSLTDGAEWAEMFPGLRIVNRGIDGDTTRGLLERVDGLLAPHPTRVFLMAGINDFAEDHRSVDAVFADYRRLVDRLRQGGAQVVVQSTLPCNAAKAAWKSCRSLLPRIRQLNARLATLAQDGVQFVSLAALAAPDGGLRSEFTFDGVHLNGRGYQLWKEAIAPLMP